MIYSPPQSAKGTYISGKNDLINITNKPRISALNMDDRDTLNVDVDVVPLDVDLNTRDLSGLEDSPMRPPSKFPTYKV